jgi:hypothetical protein
MQDFPHLSTHTLHLYQGPVSDEAAGSLSPAPALEALLLFSAVQTVVTINRDKNTRFVLSAT